MGQLVVVLFIGFVILIFVQLLLIPGPIGARCVTVDHLRLDLGSEKGIMSRRIDNPVILINHWRWLEANGYNRQAASCKRQAASLTRKHYNDIVSYTIKEKVK